MKQQLLFLLIIGNLCFSQTGVGTTTPDASAILEVQSNTKGFLPPRMTETEMNAIIAPAEGLLVYCSDCGPKGAYVFNGAEFISTITGYISRDPFQAILEDSASLGGANNADGFPVSFEQLQATGVTGLDIANFAEYQAAIAAETGFSNPPTQVAVQAIIDAVNAQVVILAAFTEVLEDSASPGGANNANGVSVTFIQLQATGVIGLNMSYLADYQSAIAAETGFSNPPSISEVQAIINAVNSALAIPSIIAASTNPASGGTPSIADLAFVGLTDLTETQVEYEEAIADALPIPTTLEDLQIIINAVNTDIPGNTTCATKPMSATPCTAQELANGIGLNGADGQPYDVVQIGDQCWMAENIDTGVADSGGWTNDTVDTGWSGYYNGTFQADKEGTLMQWSVAMDGATSERAQGICPDGWHIPSDCEWMYLENTLGMTVVDQETNSAFRGTDQGTQLKVGGTSGFEAVLTGYRVTSGSFTTNHTAHYWSSSEREDNNDRAFRRYLHENNTTIRRDNSQYKATAFTVRCVKN